MIIGMNRDTRSIHSISMAAHAERRRGEKKCVAIQKVITGAVVTWLDNYHHPTFHDHHSTALVRKVLSILL
jgi:hypothetical protein